MKVSKGAKIMNRYNQVPHLTQDTNGKVTNSQLDTTNESQEVSPYPAGVKTEVKTIVRHNILGHAHMLASSTIVVNVRRDRCAKVYILQKWRAI